MAFKHGKDSVLKVDDNGGTLRTLTAYITDENFDALERDLHDVTVHGSSGHRWHPGLANGTLTFNGFYDPTATTGPDVVLGGLQSAQSATATIEWFPSGESAGNVKYSGEFWLKTYKPKSVAADMVTFSAEFQLDGVVTRTAT